MFADILKIYRKNAALTQGQLARVLNVSTSTISMYERGERMPPPDMLLALAEYFHTDVNTLLGVQAQGADAPAKELTKKEKLINTISSQLGYLSEDEIQQVLSYARFLQQKG